MKSGRQFIIVMLAIIMCIGPDLRLWLVPPVSAQPVNPPRTSPNLKTLVDELFSATTDLTDMDGDTLPDAIETIIGTDPNSPDTDMDRLDDNFEVENDLDPIEPDSNQDGLPDYYEVNNVPSPDFDEDGIENAWDFDNDGDGVNDNVDFSPFSATAVQESFHFGITTNGNVLYASFQLRPKNPEHLKLFNQAWDWPDNDTEGSMQDRDGSKEDITLFPMLDLSVNTPPNQDDVRLYGLAVDGNNVSVPLLPIYEHGSIVAFTGRMVYPVSAPSDLDMDVKLVWKVIGRNDPNDTLHGQDTLLATYGEEFMLTGLSVEENYGTDAGVVYGSDVNELVAANLLLAYEFLRNAENNLSDIPEILDSYTLNLSRQQQTFAHRDEALNAIANTLTPGALNELPANLNLPIITLMEDRCAMLDLSDCHSTPDNSFSADAAGAPVMVSRNLKTTWYNTSTREALLTDEVMAHIRQMNLNETAAYTLMTFTLYWETGEQKFYEMINPPTGQSLDFPVIQTAVLDVLNGGLTALDILYQGSLKLTGLKEYRAAKLLQMKGWTPSIAGEPVGNLSKMGKFDQFKTLTKICDRLEGTVGVWKSMSKVMKGLGVVTLLADIGFGIYSLAVICESNADEFSKSVAILKTSMQTQYAILLVEIGFIPYVGWAIALTIAISDLIGNWSSDVIDWLGELLTGVSYQVQPEVKSLEGSSIEIDDKDNNGLTAGDRITFRTRLRGKVIGNQHYWNLVTKSSVWPYQQIYAPGGETGSLYYNEINIGCYPGASLPISEWVNFENKNQGWMAREYDAGGWVEPGFSMINFPVIIETQALYDIWYEYYVIYPIFIMWPPVLITDFGSDHQCGEYPPHVTTLYFDVLPSTLEEFIGWWEISVCDRDGDGLQDADEVHSSPWTYDTDADGLNDKYEVENGTDPQRHDTDNDGLIDWFEIQYGTDALNSDTDGDGLPDYFEVAGWLIQFDYRGQTFTVRVYSDPAIPDTDGDGVNDSMEYWSDLNPRSRDTDGDGNQDVANPTYGQTQLHFEWARNIEPYENGDPLYTPDLLDLCTDSLGNFYILRDSSLDTDVPAQWHDCVYVYDTNGSLVRSWLNGNYWLYSAALDPIGERLFLTGHDYIVESDLNELDAGFWMPGYDMIAADVDEEGNIYVVQATPGFFGNSSVILKHNNNKTLLNSWGELGCGFEQIWLPIDVAVDDMNGYLYVLQSGCDFSPGRITKFSTDGIHIGDVFDTYNHPQGIAVDIEGNLYVADTEDNVILKFNSDGMKLGTMGESGQEEGKLSRPFRIAVDDNNCVYIADRPSAYPLGRVQKFTQIAGDKPVIPDTVVDRDGDGLLSEVEAAGWDISFTDPNGARTIHVASDPLLTDTDLDGLPDPNEYQMASNPNDPDTDHDGLSDYEESGTFPKTNLLHFDTDLDGLSDGAEIAYGSDPAVVDTDQDGLSDTEEFNLGTNPRNADTDGDGVSDFEEQTKNSDPSSPDTDGDLIFDGAEIESGTDPNNGDTDQDGLADGIEIIHNADPLNPDSDNDGLTDGSEIDEKLDPTTGDTDNDGIPDGTEIEQGTNPWTGDSDHDGIPDSQDDPSSLAPDVSNAHPSKEYLWPPNNKFVEITIEGVTDPEGDPLGIAITGVTSDETSRSDKKDPDAVIDAFGRLLLRADRLGSGNGRVYEISFIAGDSKGSYTQGKVQVKVPHSNGKKGSICIDDGQNYAVASMEEIIMPGGDYKASK